jgi:hypothetical protein
MLHEVNGRLGAEGMGRFLASLDSGRTRPAWRWTFGGGGGYQRSVVASRNAVTEYADFRHISFPDSVLRGIVDRVPAESRQRVGDNMRLGLSTGGAAVEIGGRRLAAFPFDLQSAGNDPASWQDHRRRAEASLIHAKIQEALAGDRGVDGIVVAGDANLVGSDEALRRLAAPYRALGTGLETAEPLQLDGRTAATWDGREGPFVPGRLDFFLYSGRTLEVRRAFAFETRDLRERWLAAHGLRADDSAHASDHLPIVVDLQWKR